MLQRVGYYRLSAYSYPFREMLPKDSPRESHVQFRSSQFKPGHSFEDAAALYNFDRKLRLVCLDGLEFLEVGLRVQIAYTLGLRDRFGHLEPGSLDASRCNETFPTETRKNHDAWLERYEAQLHSARSEDFVTHYVLKYGGKLPVWVATEILDFGSLLRLYRLMHPWDRNRIAIELGAKTGEILHKWLLSLSLIRNTSAHHSRLWNRTLTYSVAAIPRAAVSEDLHHLEHVPDRRKLYINAALLAHLCRKLDAGTQWPSSFKTQMRKFPAIDGVSPEQSMGFPAEWEHETIWRHPGSDSA